ncbi:MAG: Ig domain-containing protein [Clostridia bacterium]|nr:Ig domain-containing protein [Clostridia bacterium]
MYYLYTGAVIPATILPNGVSIDKKTLNLSVGESETLVATITPSTATVKTVKWESSDTNVATVSGGKVTAVNPGTATIKVTTTNGGYTAKCTVTVE